MSKISDKAVKYFTEGNSCSQSVFTAFAEEYGFDRSTALRIASAFGGGMGHQGDTCGALTGALMGLGLIHGKGRAMTNEEKDKIDKIVKELFKKFKEQNGSIKCKDLLNCDISIPQERERCIREGITSKTCPDYVKDACVILQSLL